MSLDHRICARKQKIEWLPERILHEGLSHIVWDEVGKLIEHHTSISAHLKAWNGIHEYHK